MSNFKKIGHLSYYCKNQNGFNNAVKDCWNSLHYGQDISTKDEIYEVLNGSLRKTWPKAYPIIADFTPYYAARNYLSVFWIKAGFLDRILNWI